VLNETRDQVAIVKAVTRNRGEKCRPIYLPQGLRRPLKLFRRPFLTAKLYNKPYLKPALMDAYNTSILRDILIKLQFILILIINFNN